MTKNFSGYLESKQLRTFSLNNNKILAEKFLHGTDIEKKIDQFREKEEEKVIEKKEEEKGKEKNVE